MSDKLVTIANFAYGSDPVTDAELARIKLESEGISCFIEGKNLGGMDWFLVILGCIVKLQVKESDAKRAMEILGKVEPHNADLPVEEPECMSCPRCKSTDVTYEKFSKKWAYLSMLLFRFPLPFLKKNYTCNACGHIWKKEI